MKHRFRPVPDQAWAPIPRGHASSEDSVVKECRGCGERIVLPPPRGMTKRQYFRKIGIHPDCDLQKVAQVMES